VSRDDYGNGEKPWTGMGALIKLYREERRVTQRELAAAAGMSVGALRDLEQGRTRSPRWGAMEGLAAVLGLGQAQRAELARCWQPGAATPRERPAPRWPGIRINVLGPLAAWRDGQRLGLGSARQRAVLGLLAVHSEAGVHRDAIIDLLWDERPPASAVAKVQSYLSRLRKMLGDGAARAGSAELVTSAGGRCYRLNAGADHLDLAAFSELTRQAREAAGRLDRRRACDRYEHALGLWRGDILVDVDLLRGHPAVIEVTRQRAEAVLGYAEAATGGEVRTRALPHLRELCTREPLNEHAHARLMIALAVTGEQAAALEVFTDLRLRLDTELGVSPSPVLAQAQAQILRRHLGPPPG
jgi:DNA-binding SARP family transcriptional activator/DNA-binding XRE family transcriptional regulator